MYLPTEATTIYNVLIERERISRRVWATIVSKSPEQARTVAHYEGKMDALMSLRDGLYIV